MEKLSKRGDIAQLGPKEKAIYAFIENHPGSRSGEIAEKLDILLPTVKKILTDMVRKKHIAKNGAGAGTL
jgi:DNA-binding MarR family transcriptional regulator